GVDRAELRFQKPPVDRPRQLHQRVVHVDDLIKPRAEQIMLTALPSLAWSHRKSPLHQLEREESRLVIRGNPQNRICKKIALQRPKTGKFDYLSEPNHPAHSMAFKFFTDDERILLPADGVTQIDRKTIQPDNVVAPLAVTARRSVRSLRRCSPRLPWPLRCRYCRRLCRPS